MGLVDWCERGLVPDPLARFGMRMLVRQRLLEEGAGGAGRVAQRQQAFLDALGRGPIAVHTEDANAQHYEVPSAFFVAALGARLKYSCCWYPAGDESLDVAEAAMLALSVERAGVADGMTVLDLGCGWGSMALWLAEKFPGSRICAVSNSATQKAFIDARAAARGFTNLSVATADINGFDATATWPGVRFDRVLSVEMFEHMRNWQALLAKVAGWLAPDGRLFVHIFCHRELGYPFEDRGASDWMSRHFFTGGIMPRFDQFRRLDLAVQVEDEWWIPGTHYQRTCNQWLQNADAARATILPLFAQCYGSGDAAVWLQRWRMFFMACAELFGIDGGRQFGVGHYRLTPR